MVFVAGRWQAVANVSNRTKKTGLRSVDNYGIVRKVSLGHCSVLKPKVSSLSFNQTPLYAPFSYFPVRLGFTVVLSFIYRSMVLTSLRRRNFTLDMIRFLLDFQTTDIIVITNDSIQKVNFYYVADFLEIEKNENGEYKLSIREIFGALLNHWKLLLSQDSNEVFLVYDLSDEYISAFHLENVDFQGREYVKITRRYTQELSGWSVSKSLSLPELKDKKWEIDNDFSVQGSRNTLLRSINWSLENLRINTNSVNL